MHQIGVVDYTFYLDRHKTNAAVGNVIILDKEAENNLFKVIRNNIENNIQKSIIHRTVIKESPIKDDYPYLVEDENLNIDNHIFEYNKDGKESNIQNIYDLIMKKRLREDIPLWDIHIVYNINEKKQIAIFRRYHHSLGDSDAHAQVYDIICDNFKSKKIKLTKKLNRLNCKINHYYKLIKHFYLYSIGFLFKNNKIQEKRPSRSDLYKGSWMRRSATEQGIFFFKVDIKDYKNKINAKDVSILNACVYAISEMYSNLLKAKNKNNLTILSLFPISYRKEKSKPYGNMAVSTYLDLKINENNKTKKFNLLKKELNDKIDLVKKSPRFLYGRAIECDPRPSRYKKSWEAFNKNNWNNRKKIPKKEKESVFVSTSISFKTIKKSAHRINSFLPQEMYNFSMPIPTPGSIGCTTSVRHSGDYLYIGISFIKDLYPEPNLFKDLYINSLKEVLEIV